MDIQENTINQNQTPIQTDLNRQALETSLAFDRQMASLKTKESFWKAYSVSILLPPGGLYYFVKFFFFRDNEFAQRKAAIICLILTTVSLLFNLWIFQFFFNQTVSTIPNGSQNPDYMKELITPENRKTLRDLLQ